ncbi:MAG: peptide deformylase [Deltaproteobacteria bacterium]|nr:peptide deformylase [Deltaproteobacteria bacterium]
MARLTIFTYPAEVLRTKSRMVSAVDNEIGRLIDDMAETMYAAPGVGLAANQVGVLKRVVVIDVSYVDGEPNLIALVNPEIVECVGEAVNEEGCLSFPSIKEDIKRAACVAVRALDRDGRPVEIRADGLLATALQHEIDHLDGVSLIDKVSFLKRRMIHRQLSKDKSAG